MVSTFKLNRILFTTLKRRCQAIVDIRKGKMTLCYRHGVMWCMRPAICPVSLPHQLVILGEAQQATNTSHYQLCNQHCSHSCQGHRHQVIISYIPPLSLQQIVFSLVLSDVHTSYVCRLCIVHSCTVLVWYLLRGYWQNELAIVIRCQQTSVTYKTTHHHYG